MSTLNVLRYTSLLLGVVVGIKNDWALRGAAKRDEHERSIARELKLVKEAKEEYNRLHPIKQANTTEGDINFNLEDPNFDFGTAIVRTVEALKQ